MKIRFLLILILIHTGLLAQISKQRVLIGDTLSYSYVTYNNNTKLITNCNQEELSCQTIRLDTLANASIKHSIVLQPWIYGTYSLFNDSIHHDTFEVKQLQANQLFVDTPVVDLNKDIRDVVDYKEKRSYTTLILFGIIVFILLSALLYLFSKIVQSNKRKLNPLVYSLQLLKATSISNVADKVQEAIKHYLQYRLDIPALATPSKELQFLIVNHSITQRYSEDLRTILARTDLIKYAQEPVSEPIQLALAKQTATLIKALESSKIAELEATKQARKRNSR